MTIVQTIRDLAQARRRLPGLLSGDGIGWAMDRMGAYFLRSIYITLAVCVLAGLGWIVFYL